MKEFLERIKRQDPTNPDSPLIQRFSDLKLVEGFLLVKKHKIGEKTAGGLYTPASSHERMKSITDSIEKYKHNDTLGAEVLMVGDNLEHDIKVGDWIVSANMPFFNLLILVDDRPRLMIEEDDPLINPVIDCLLIHQNSVQAWFSINRKEDVNDYS